MLLRDKKSAGANSVYRNQLPVSLRRLPFCRISICLFYYHNGISCRSQSL